MNRFLTAFLIFTASLKAADPFYSFVVLQAQWIGANASTTVYDDKGHALTAQGNAALTTSIFPNGMTSSLALDGTGDYVSTVNSTDFDLGSGDWTIEGFFYFASTAASVGMVSHYIGGPCSGSNNCGYAIRWLTSNNIRLVNPSDATIDRAFTPSTTTWYHWAICKANGTGRMFINGTQIGTSFSDALNYDAGSLTNVQMGRTHTITDDFNGNFGPIRITKGYARYTANFTTPTIPFSIGASASDCIPGDWQCD